jgi:hypothetical protein
MKEKTDVRKIIFVSLICIVLISVSVYFIFIKNDKKNFGEFNPNNPNDDREGNFSITPETENEITSFFQNSPSDSEIETYCQQNPMYCQYYCMKNTDAEFCSEFKPNDLERGMPPNETGIPNQY